ncbi:MAG: FAD-dependent oxidoreductase [Planctomycetota bacterium]
MPKYTDFDMPVKIAGVTFRNPFFVSSGPTTMTIEQLERIRDNGWAAASLKLTVYPLPYINRAPRYGWYQDIGLLTFTAEKRLILDELLKLIEIGRKRTPELILYANITYAGDAGAEGWVKMAKACEAAGAHIIELNMCCPNMSFNVQLTGKDCATNGPKTGASMGSQEEIVKTIVGAVKKALKVPLFLKLTPEGGQIGPISKAAVEAGADAVGGAANRLAIPPINHENPTHSMYYLQKEIGMACTNGPWLKPLGQRDVYEMRNSCGPKAVISGVGGVFEPTDAIEYVMCGADLIGMCTATIVKGFGFMPNFIKGVKEYMKAHNYKSLRDIRDMLVPAITSAPNLTIYDGHAKLKDIRPTAPCMYACPNSVPAQGYVRAVANENFDVAFQLITAKSPLQYACGKVCDHPCEKECTRGLKDAPIMIRAIKRFVLEMGKKNGWKPKIFDRRGKNRDTNVAVVGSGPAGLAAAFDLARAGYKVTVFEAAPKLGGMLRYGIPAYRFNDEDVNDEIKMVKSLGVNFKTRKALGRDFTISSLRKNGYKAVFLGVGAQKGMSLNVDGEDAKGNLSAIDFLRDVTSGNRPEIRKSVAVVGGGFTAVDAARAARRLGAKDVFILYRRTRSEMPATEDEVWEAEEEGVKVMYLVAPREILIEDGKVRGIRMLNHTLESKKDDSGRRRPIEAPGTEFTLKVDTVISAIGQSVDFEDACMTEKGMIETDDQTLATSVKGVYAGGDCVLGPKDVISAVAQGKRAAVSIDKMLAGKNAFLEYDAPKVEVDKDAALARHGQSKRAWRPDIVLASPEKRVKNFDDYTPVLTKEQAVKEAQRCLACGCGAGCQICHDLCKMFAYTMDEFGQVQLNEKKCVACGVCAQRCPNAGIEMVQTSTRPL